MRLAHNIPTHSTKLNGFIAPAVESCVRSCCGLGIPNPAPVPHAPAHGGAIAPAAAHSAYGVASCATLLFFAFGGRGNTSTIAYDSLGNVAWVADALNNTTEFFYDSLNRRIETVNAIGHFDLYRLRRP